MLEYTVFIVDKVNFIEFFYIVCLLHFGEKIEVAGSGIDGYIITRSSQQVSDYSRKTVIKLGADIFS